VRPVHLAVAPGPDDLDQQGRVDAAVDKGIDPSRVADMVVAAVHEERFLLITHPEHETGLRRQTEILLAGGLPPL
jgi:hypothetical protein